MRNRITILSIILIAITMACVPFIYGNSKKESIMMREKDKTVVKTNDKALIKSFIQKLSAEREKDNSTFPDLIKETEKFLNERTDSTVIAFLHSMLAQMYQNYYDENRWKINQRTNLLDYIPDDIREWTQNIFKQKIEDELSNSLSPALLLQNTPLKSFSSLLENDKYDKKIEPTLFDLLAQRAISIHPCEQWYKLLIDFRKSRPEEKYALMMDELMYLKYKYNNDIITWGQYYDSLNNLTDIYYNEPYAAEILIQKVEYCSYRTDEFSKDYIYNICKDGIDKYSSYPRISKLKNILAQLEQPYIGAESPNEAYPDNEIKIKLTYKNVPEVNVKVYRCGKELPNVIYGPRYEHTNLVKDMNVEFSLPNTYTKYDTTIVVPTSNIGIYEYVISYPKKGLNVWNKFNVSRLALATKSVNNKIEVYVADFKSGKPLQNATVKAISSNHYNNKEIYNRETITNKYGLAKFDSIKGWIDIKASFKEDSFALEKNVCLFGARGHNDSNYTSVSIFTDRKIYKPGQTVKFKGIAYNEKKQRVVPNKKYIIELLNPQGEMISKQTVTTDEFGGFDGEFSLPTSTLNGSFRINCKDGDCEINVENYVKPNVELLFEPIGGQIIFGKPIIIKGNAKTFSGVSLTDGKIEWDISEIPHWWFRQDINNRYSTSGVSVLNQNGEFTIEFTPSIPTPDNPNIAVYKSYNVTAKLVTANGETIESETSFSVGSQGLITIFSLEGDKINKEEAEIGFKTVTVNHEPTTVLAKYSIFEMRDDAENISKFEKGKQVASGEIMSGDLLSSEFLKRLPSGRYMLSTECEDEYGNAITDSTVFILYSPTDKRPPVYSPLWITEDKIECEAGVFAKFSIGTSLKDAYILYQLIDEKERPIQTEIIKASDQNKQLSFLMKKEYNYGCMAQFYLVKDGNFYNENITIKNKSKDKVLTIKTMTFRDNITTGAKEKWRFKVLMPDSLPANAQVLASMYDAALDKIIPFKWEFYPIRLHEPDFEQFNQGDMFDTQIDDQEVKINYSQVKDVTYAAVNWYGLFSYRFSGARPRYMKNLIIDMSNISSNEDTTEDEVEFYQMSPREEETKQQIRTDFAETAFFYPTMTTNCDGVVDIKFEVPQSNTTWKLQLLAQTKELDYGYASMTTVSSKPIMVQPNVPTYLRAGDETTISTLILNRTGKNITGNVHLILSDARTGKQIDGIDNTVQEFNINANSNATVNWTFKTPFDTNNLLICKIIADSPEASDGEQHYIPVIPNDIMLTESTPFFLFDKDKESVSLSPLSKNACPIRYTLEMTANPIWYAVQALPSITEKESSNAVSLFASYYGNILANHIANSNPKIKQAVSEWKAKGGDAKSLISKLENNQGLKNILLSETPWILEWKNETEQIRQLSLLFDSDRSERQAKETLAELISIQNHDGGWGWFEGMISNSAITDYILYGMAQLSRLGAMEHNEITKIAQDKAIKYMDKEITRNYEYDTKRLPKIAAIYPSVLSYLYTRSFYSNAPDSRDARDAIQFYTAQAYKRWNEMAVMGKARVCGLAWRNEKYDIASKIAKNLQSLAIVNPTKGMYWASNSFESFFYSPIARHCLLMEVLGTVVPDKKETDQMKQWLLSQKQTQRWSTVPATTYAIHALLSTGSNWLSENNVCTAQIGDRKYVSTSGDSITGYLSEEIPLVDTEKNPIITISKQGEAPAWGAVYQQYLSPISEVKQKGGSLNLQRTLFVEKTHDGNKVLVPITESTPIQIGDKVVSRIVINSDRAMDYVCLKEQRGACFLPTGQLSELIYRDGIYYYQTANESSTEFFIDRLPEGTFVLEYSMFATRQGTYTVGVSTIQCLYAPEFVSHSDGITVIVK